MRSARDIKTEFCQHIENCIRQTPSTRKFVDLNNWLESTDYWTAPASTRYHAAFEGGLAYHSFKMAKILENFTRLHNIRWDCPHSPWIISLLHDVCKIGVYKKEQKSRRVTDGNGHFLINVQTGKHIWEDYEGYVYDDFDCPMGHGAKSVIVTNRHFRLTEQEELCILWHMGVLTSDLHIPIGFTRATQKDVAVFWTHVADRLASIEEFRETLNGTASLLPSSEADDIF